MANIFLFNPPGPSGKNFIREGRCTQEAGVWATMWPPVTLVTAAAILEKDGHVIKVVDFPATGLGLPDLIHTFCKDQIDFAIWNTGTPTLDFDLSLAGLIKKTSPETVTAVMGTHVSVSAETVLSRSPVDVVIRREPELTIKNLCRKKNGARTKIPGISYRDRHSKNINHNIDSPFILPDKIPFPAWHYLDLRPYRLPLKGRRFLIVAPVRGCPYSCSFCTAPVYYGRKLRKRPVENVMDEIEENIARYKIKDFFIWADTFTADKKYVERFCKKIIQRKLDISWTCNSRVDTVDAGILSLMKKAGLWMISYGLESGSETVLKRSGKNITLKQSKNAVETAAKLGIKTSGHFILGLPGESVKRMNQTLQFSLDLPLDIAQFYTAAPFPGTDLCNEAIEKGWLKNDKILSQSTAVMELPGLSARKVDNFRRYAYKKFFLRKSAIIRILKMLEPGALRNINMNLTGFLKWIKG